MHSPEAVKAAELANAECCVIGVKTLTPTDYSIDGMFERRAFARYIREVSDAVKAACDLLDEIGDRVPTLSVQENLSRFILPDPVDPLAAIITDEQRQALTAAGYEVRKVVA